MHLLTSKEMMVVRDITVSVAAERGLELLGLPVTDRAELGTVKGDISQQVRRKLCRAFSCVKPFDMIDSPERRLRMG